MAAQKNFDNKLKDFLKEKGCWFIKYWAGADFTKSGIPDLLCCINGHFVGVELKAENGKTSDLQFYQLNQINKANGIGIVLRPSQFEKFKKLVEELLTHDV